MDFNVTFLAQAITVRVPEGTSLLDAQIRAGLHPDAPCGGKGTCGKCTVTLNGKQLLACRTPVDRDMTVLLPPRSAANILTGGKAAYAAPDGSHRFCLAYDVGTTTIVAYLLDGSSGALLANTSTVNPQAQFGADVIARIQHAVAGGSLSLKDSVCDAMRQLALDAAQASGVDPREITSTAIVGNTAMHHLLLGIDPTPLITPPYMPNVRKGMEFSADALLPVNGTVRMLPNIAGFVGGDTVGCMVATRFDRLDKLTLLIDIGTNGEMVLGDRNSRVACSTAAGPAFEGAKISCGMRGEEGAVDHVVLSEGKIIPHTIGEGPARGLCGSGLLDLIAILLDTGILDESGYLAGHTYELSDIGIILTQKDIREVQLAKAAIRAGVELLTRTMGVKTSDIQQVYLAGAFGNYMDPASACRIGMIPPCLKDRIQPIGNAAGEGAKLCALSRREYEYANSLAESTAFLELASMPEFQDVYVDALGFMEDDGDEL